MNDREFAQNGVRCLQQTQFAESPVGILPLGETAIVVEFGHRIHPEIHRKVKTLADYLDHNPLPGMIEYVAAFSSITVYYDPMKVKSPAAGRTDTGQFAYQTVTSWLQAVVARLDYPADDEPRLVEIPVCYGGPFGPDLACVADHNQLTAEEVIEIHSGRPYLVYMLGFAPGFPYLGGMSERIATPRRLSPRTSIPAGSVGIAGMQTGVYPISTPGGWQLIGRTPLELFCPGSNPPTLLRAGDQIRFYPISRQEYEAYKGEGQ